MVLRLLLGFAAASSLLATNWCGVPVIVGRFLVQSVPAMHGFIVLDLADPAHPVEVSRLKIDDHFRDTDGKVGFSFGNREWPHGWKGTGLPHGAVFSR